MSTASRRTASSVFLQRSNICTANLLLSASRAMNCHKYNGFIGFIYRYSTCTQETMNGHKYIRFIHIYSLLWLYIPNSHNRDMNCHKSFRFIGFIYPYSTCTQKTMNCHIYVRFIKCLFVLRVYSTILLLPLFDTRISCSNLSFILDNPALTLVLYLTILL